VTKFVEPIQVTEAQGQQKSPPNQRAR